MAEYKLTIVEKYPDLGEVHITTIGYFKNEEALVQWAENNQGEIDKV